MPIKEEPVAAKPVAAKPIEEKPAEPKPAFVKCECNASRHHRPGEVVSRWGYSWEVGPDGVKMTCMIPTEDVENGVAAGRWVAEGMPEEQRSELFWFRQYQELLGTPPKRGMSADEARSAVLAEERRRGGEPLVG